MFKLPHNCTHLPCQQSNAQNPPRQAGFRKGRGTRDLIANIQWIIRTAREFQKNIYFCFIDYAKASGCVDQSNLENSSRDQNTRPPDLPPEKSVCRSGSNSQNLTWNNSLVQNWERSQGSILSSCLFNFYAEYIMQKKKKKSHAG